MAIYDECSDIYMAHMKPYLDRPDPWGSCDDDYIVWQSMVKAVKAYVEKNYPDTPHMDCWHCKESLPHTTIAYDSGWEVNVCVVCGFNYEPKEAN